MPDGTPIPCRWEESAPAYVLGELSPAERAAFTAHAAGCAACRGEVEAAREVLARLAALPPEPPGRDLAPAILAQIPRAAAPRARRAPLAAAAAVLLAAASVWTLSRRPPPATAPPAHAAAPASPVANALAWLASAQGADGLWDAARWGGHDNFTVAVTGLSLMAFLETGPVGEAHAAAADRAARALLRAQDAGGHFGRRAGGSLYNHAIATAALLDLYAARRRDGGGADLRGAIDRALRVIRETQTKTGGWGYAPGTLLGTVGPPADAPNTSLSVWPLVALAKAREAGWPGMDEPLTRGAAWLSAVTDEVGRVGYRRPRDFPYGPETLAAMGAFAILSTGTADSRLRKALAAAAKEDAGGSVDYYRAFFLSRALAAADPPTPAGVAALARRLAARQVSSGPFAGSWEPVDRWSAAGGRVYATAVAALALADPGRPR